MLPKPVSGRARHDDPAGDNETEGHRNEAASDNGLPLSFAETIPNTIGREIYCAGRAERRDALAIAPGKPQTCQPTKLIIRIMFGPGMAWANAKRLLNSWSVSQP